MLPTIRVADQGDADQILAIYAPFCIGSPTSFETAAPTLEEMRGRIEQTLDRYPWLVCAEAGVVLGYAYAGRHRERAAYRWSVDSSVYVREDQRGSGIGRALYASLFAVLKLQGFQNVLAGATLPNPASVGLHLAMGFAPIGTYRGIGYKGGAWHDVQWWQLDLRSERATSPAEPIDLPSARALSGWKDALDAGLRWLRHADLPRVSGGEAGEPAGRGSPTP